jgi:hypothetical protein
VPPAADCKGNGRQLFDLSADPYETTNVLGRAPAALVRPAVQPVRRTRTASRPFPRGKRSGAAPPLRQIRRPTAPQPTQSLLPARASPVRRPPRPQLARLDALLSVLVHCSGPDCRHPLGFLHPGGDVLTFEQASARAREAPSRARQPAQPRPATVRRPDGAGLLAHSPRLSCLHASPAAQLCRVWQPSSRRRGCRPAALTATAPAWATAPQAMDPRHNALYAALPRFAFKTCYPLYVPGAAPRRTRTCSPPC